jgi:hypothetical protein
VGLKVGGKDGAIVGAKVGGTVGVAVGGLVPLQKRIKLRNSKKPNQAKKIISCLKGFFSFQISVCGARLLGRKKDRPVYSCCLGY